MSSSDDGRNVFAVKPTADETVPLMNDTTNKEKEYYKSNRFWRGSADDDWEQVYCWRSFMLSHGILSLLGLPGIAVGAWALVLVTSYFSTFAIVVSALLVAVGVVMVLGGIAHILFIRYSGAQNESKQLMRCALIFSVHYFLPIVVITLGITTGALIPNLSTQLSANTTFNNYLNDQSVQANFDNVQCNIKCCGVMAFTDYENIFNNLSVPVSCCNTTNPLANETTCPEIVSNAQQANQTGLIYSEGCVPLLQSVLQYILSVAAGVSIMIGVLQFFGNAISWCLYCVFVFHN